MVLRRDFGEEGESGMLGVVVGVCFRDGRGRRVVGRDAVNVLIEFLIFLIDFATFKVVLGVAYMRRWKSGLSTRNSRFS